jgi:DNA-binding MarR family transcriptional regulator
MQASHRTTTPGTRLTELELRAWQAFLHAHHGVVTQLDDELRTRHDLTFPTYDVLLRLARAEGGSLRMTELAKRVLMSPSGLTRLVDGLAKRGLVERTTFQGDGRVTLVRLTPGGRTLLRSAARTHLAGIRRHLTGRLSPAQLRSLASVLETVTGPHRPH